MHVIATAGHVDHGKSTLVRALTGAEPDRLAEEHRRGLSIELGYVWTTFDRVGDVAFVDVPGHERFVSTMLAGVGPVPAALFVVAADDPWMPQAAEHLAALDALGVRHGVLAVTRADLADPQPALARARERLARTSLAAVPAVAVSGRTGTGIDELRDRLVDVVTALPEPDPTAPVRLWADRVFHVRGTGTVVTGTLPAGSLRVGDVLMVDDEQVRVRALECLGRPVSVATGVSRVAVALSGKAPRGLSRGTPLTTPGAWLPVSTLDVRLTVPGRPPERPMLHVGAAATQVRSRPLDDTFVRLTLGHPLPLRIGDRALLRDPGSREVWGVEVVDPVPPELVRRGAARFRAKELADADGSLAGELRRREVVRRSVLERTGVPTDPLPHGTVEAAGWLVAPDVADRLRARLPDVVAGASTPLEPAVPVAVVARALGLPAPELVAPLVTPPLQARDGRVHPPREADTLPPGLEAACRALEAELAERPFAAPTAGRLAELGLDVRAVAALAKAGRVLRLGDGVVLLAGADMVAVARLRTLPQPFTTSAARSALDTSRRVALPLLGHLDRRGLTRRLPDDRRETTS